MAARPKPNAPSGVENIKETSNHLRGTLAEQLHNDTDHFDESGKHLLKFHGLYQQDDRDQRKSARANGGKEHSFMLRTRVPGGLLTAEQYLAHDDLAQTYANGTLRITTRQCFQFHGIIKGDLQATIRGLNDALITSLGACGDVVRNVACCPAPFHDPIRTQIQAVTRQISDHLLPRTQGYHELWIDGEQVALEAPPQEEHEPIYGKTYLPRKFKIAVAYPGDNCVDVYTQDIGLVAIAHHDRLIGFNVIVGGGMGMNHTKADTFPRLGDLLGFVTPEQVLVVVEAIVTVQRDYGNRSDRKHARMKYLLHEWGVDRFRDAVEARLGWAVQAPAPMLPLENQLHHGWHAQGDERWFLGLSVENGRIKDEGDLRLRAGLRAVVERFRPGVRLTANQDILLTDIAAADIAAVNELLASHGIPLPAALSVVQRNSLACVALPTCALALAEAERALPEVIDGLEVELVRLELAAEPFTVRMTGCPNGCARPYVADLAFVGRSTDRYVIFVGGASNGTRLNQPYKDLVEREHLVDEVRPLLEAFRDTRRLGERFGDFCHRLGVDALLQLTATQPEPEETHAAIHAPAAR
ncbi:MAG: NADPH-dependent assimilatory sulfite reductase hemoprotein subunit [Caldilineaceae bacterium]|nr:NADPH-dependent assimilatory sulfite reductase hemoprotein subunit [Caldilineaceae bacterium]